MKKQLQMILEKLSNIKNNEGAEALTENKIKDICKAHSVSFEKLQDSVLEILIDAGITEEKFESLSLNDLSKISGGVSNTKRNAALLAAFLNLNSMAGSYATTKPENNISTSTIACNNDSKKRNNTNPRHYLRLFSVLAAILGIGGESIALHKKQRTVQKLEKANAALKQEINDSNNDQSVSKRHISALTHDKLELQKQNDNLKQRNITLDTANTKLTADYEALERQNSELVGTNASLQTTCTALQTQNRDLTNETTRLQQENARLNNTVKTLYDQGARLQQEEIDYFKIQDALKNPKTCKLNEKEIQELQKKYQNTERFRAPLAKLSKQIFRRTNNIQLTNTQRLASLFPNDPSVKDPPPRSSKINPPVYQSGAYLKAKKYMVKGPLGYGGCGVTWVCRSKSELNGSKVMKVLKPDPRVSEPEITSTQIVADILKNDTTGKAKRYLPSLRVVSTGDTHIIRSPLADGDLWNLYYKEGNYRIDFNEVLRYAKQALKSVKVLHDAGYTHNDIKPENFLRISTWSNKKENDQIMTQMLAILQSHDPEYEKMNKILKIPSIYTLSKQLAAILRNHDIDATLKLSQISNFVRLKQTHTHKLQLSDFGTLGKLDFNAFTSHDKRKSFRLAEWPHIYTEAYYCAADVQTALTYGLWFENNDSAKSTFSGYATKRDVYALGVTLLWFLLRPFNTTATAGHNFPAHASYLQNSPPDPLTAADLFYRANSDALSTYLTTTSYQRLLAFIALIHKMINTNITQRITLDAALTELYRIINSR